MLRVKHDSTRFPVPSWQNDEVRQPMEDEQAESVRVKSWLKCSNKGISAASSVRGCMLKSLIGKSSELRCMFVFRQTRVGCVWSMRAQWCSYIAVVTRGTSHASKTISMHPHGTSHGKRYPCIHAPAFPCEGH